METNMEVQILLFFTILLTLIVGFFVGWFINDRYFEWLEHASYAKSIFHPEMYDAEGKLTNEELMYLHIDEDYFDDENEEKV